MHPEEIEKHRRQLSALGTRLTQTVDRSVNAVIESISPPGEHEQAPAEGVDGEIMIGRNEAEMLTAVNAALDRIDRREYGTCAGCGRPIAAARLAAVPWADRCTACEREHESKRPR